MRAPLKTTLASWAPSINIIIVINPVYTDRIGCVRDNLSCAGHVFGHDTSDVPAEPSLAIPISLFFLCNEAAKTS